MKMLILDPETAAVVTGPTARGHALDPRPLADGTFALPVRVLADPAHAMHHETLRNLPLRPAAECVWADVDDD